MPRVQHPVATDMITDVPDDKLQSWLDQGWLEVDAEGKLLKAAKPPSIKDVLAEVGDDPEKAAAALEAEQAGSARPTLVEKLQGIADSQNDGA